MTSIYKKIFYICLVGLFYIGILSKSHWNVSFVDAEAFSLYWPNAVGIIAIPLVLTGLAKLISRRPNLPYIIGIVISVLLPISMYSSYNQKLSADNTNNAPIQKQSEVDIEEKLPEELEQKIIQLSQFINTAQKMVNNNTDFLTKIVNYTITNPTVMRIIPAEFNVKNKTLFYLTLKSNTNDTFWIGVSSLDETVLEDFSSPSYILATDINCKTYKWAMKTTYVFEKSIFLGRYKIYRDNGLVWEAMTNKEKSLMCGNQ